MGVLIAVTEVYAVARMGWNKGYEENLELAGKEVLTAGQKVE